METVRFEWDSQRIDRYLPQITGYSRNFFHHIIDRGGILVNNCLVKKSYILKSWDTINIDRLQRYFDAWVLEETPEIDLPVLMEQEDYLVIYKPKWVLSHPSSVRDVNQPSVVGFLYHRYKQLPSMGAFLRAWLLHRLDKDTDGCMLVALTERGLAHFKSLFMRKSQASSIEEKFATPLKKFYLAQCVLTPSWTKWLASHSLPSILQSPILSKVPHSTGPKEWITIIQQANLTAPNRLELDIQILTWRTHQIRYHCSQIWLPIVGDTLYGWPESQKMMLTAVRLEFLDPDGNYQIVNCFDKLNPTEI